MLMTIELDEERVEPIRRPVLRPVQWPPEPEAVAFVVLNIIKNWPEEETRSFYRLLRDRWCPTCGRRNDRCRCAIGDR